MQNMAREFLMQRISTVFLRGIFCTLVAIFASAILIGCKRDTPPEDVATRILSAISSGRLTEVQQDCTEICCEKLKAFLTFSNVPPSFKFELASVEIWGNVALVKEKIQPFKDTDEMTKGYLDCLLFEKQSGAWRLLMFGSREEVLKIFRQKKHCNLEKWLLRYSDDAKEIARTIEEGLKTANKTMLDNSIKTREKLCNIISSEIPGLPTKYGPNIGDVKIFFKEKRCTSKLPPNAFVLPSQLTNANTTIEEGNCYEVESIRARHSLKAGDVVNMGMRFGVAIDDIEERKFGDVVISGAFSFECPANFSCNRGDLVYFDLKKQKVVPWESATTEEVGRADCECKVGDKQVIVNINASFGCGGSMYYCCRRSLDADIINSEILFDDGTPPPIASGGAAPAKKMPYFKRILADYIRDLCLGNVGRRLGFLEKISIEDRIACHDAEVLISRLRGFPFAELNRMEDGGYELVIKKCELSAPSQDEVAMRDPFSLCKRRGYVSIKDFSDRIICDNKKRNWRADVMALTGRSLADRSALIEIGECGRMFENSEEACPYDIDIDGKKLCVLDNVNVKDDKATGQLRNIRDRDGLEDLVTYLQSGALSAMYEFISAEITPSTGIKDK